MKKRIGNDITFVWHIYRKDGDTQTPESFTGKEVEVKLISPLQRPVTIEDVSIATGVVTFTFRGKHQVTLGNYVAVLLENKGEDGMVTLDVVNAVTLVPHSYMEEDGDEGDVIEAEAVELESSISAGSGGGIEQQQADWAQTDASAVDFIKNKPNLDEYAMLHNPNRFTETQVIEDKRYRATFTQQYIELRDKAIPSNPALRIAINGIYKVPNAGTTNGVVWEETATSQIPAATTEANGLMSAEDKGKLNALPTNTELTEELSGKQDTINDLPTIRSGAQAGATAYQQPTTGIPATDLASAVQVSLGKADTALQEHQSLAGLVNTGSYNTVSKKIELKHDNTVLAEIDATAFIKDGMVDSVIVSNGYIVVTFNTDAGKETIRIPVTDIFDPDNYYDKNDVDGLLAGKANTSDLAEVATSGSYNDLSDKPDLSSFITRSVDDLTNYYLKSETYTKNEVLQLIGAIQQFHYEVYPTLPQTGASNVLYLIGPTGSGSDKYEEYVYANDTFTKIGDTSIDLSGYVTTQALTTALADYVTSSALSTILSSYVNKDEIDDVPTANSKNPVTSGGVYGTTPSIKNTDAESDLDISDEDENVLMRLSDGHIKTKNFDSVLFSRINSDVDYDNEVVATTSANSTLLYQQHKSIGSFDFDFKWVGGCLAENGRIYGITNGNRQVLEINPETDTYCLFGNLSSGSFKWSGCGIWKNGKIYGYPRSANSVLIIDPLTQGVEEVDLRTNYEPNHHYGGCIVGDHMYLAPRTANHILKINLKTWQIERLGENILTDTMQYNACIYHPNGYVYFIPNANAKILKLNPLNDAITELGSVLQSCSVYGASVAPSNKCIYGFTGHRTNGGILKIDVENNDTISFIHEGTVGTGYYSTELALNGKLYSGVGNGTDVWELDPTNDTVTIVDTISDTVGGDYNEAKCAGGVLAENGSIYLIPAKGRHIYKLEFDGQVVRTMPRKVLMSNYFSNY